MVSLKNGKWHISGREKKYFTKKKSPIVGSGEDGNAFAIVSFFVAIRFDFVATNYVIEMIVLQETGSNVWSKLDSHACLYKENSLNCHAFQ